MAESKILKHRKTDGIRSAAISSCLVKNPCSIWKTNIEQIFSSGRLNNTGTIATLLTFFLFDRLPPTLDLIYGYVKEKFCLPYLVRLGMYRQKLHGMGMNHGVNFRIITALFRWYVLVVIIPIGLSRGLFKELIGLRV